MLDREKPLSYTGMMTRLNRLSYCPLILLLSISFLVQTFAENVHSPLVVFLVRHAEKVDTSADPALSAEGIARAQSLKVTLRDAGITHVHSSDYKRTRDTAAPIAALLEKNVQLYDSLNPSELVSKLMTEGGRHLVVGHSNTTPALVKRLGGKPGPPIVEKNEYDRLYIITVNSDGSVNTVLRRYPPRFDF
jgi:2,3-bisphosphoglycerate-dependent phosphoglycerate mutase